MIEETGTGINQEVQVLEPTHQTEVVSPTIKDVRRLVVPDGPCKGLEGVKAKIDGRTIKKTIYLERENEEVNRLAAEAEEKTSPIKTIFSQALDNDKLTYVLARKTQGEEITREEIREIMGAPDENLL